MNIFRLLSLVLASTASLTATANSQCQISSQPHRVALLELFTSEGCSSCPPADKFVSTLKDNHSVVPIAFHMDYWNYIGWKDKFSKAEYTKRQKYHAATNKLSSLYTPQYVVNGKDVRGWSSSDKVTQAISKSNTQAPGANIQLTYASGDDKNVTIKAQFQLAEDRRALKQAVAYLALYENNINTPVKAGENEGRTLHHDYVIRQFIGPFLVPNSADGLEIDHNFTLDSDYNAKQLGVAAFVQNLPNGEVLQAMSAPVCH